MSAFDKLPADVRAKLEQRQFENGFSDIDGLKEEVDQMGYGEQPGLSRSSLGYINAQLKRSAERIRAKQQAMSAVLEALGPHAQDIGLVNAALFHDAIQDTLSQLDMHALDLSDLEATERLAVFIKLAKAQLDVSKSVQPLKQERRQDLSDFEKQKAEAVEAAVSMAQKANGLSDETAQAIRDKVLFNKHG
jgi:hypothetical protein